MALSRRSMGTGSFLVASIESLEGCSDGGTAEGGDSAWNGLSSNGDDSAAGAAEVLGARRATFLTALFHSR